MQSGYGVSDTQQFMVDSYTSLSSFSQELQHQNNQRFLHHLNNNIPVVTQQHFQHPQFHDLLQQQLEGSNDEYTRLRCDDGRERGEEFAINETFWKSSEMEYINKNDKKRCREELEISNKYNKRVEEGKGKSIGNNYRLFNELEAIYSHSNRLNDSAQGGVGGGRGGPSGINRGSKTSTEDEEEAYLKKLQVSRKKRKRKQLSSFASFFQSLMKQVMDHQEVLYRKFSQVMERRDRERMDREEDWRRQEAAKSNTEAIARAQEQALSSTREAAMISFLEKITGKRITNLPRLPQINSRIQQECQQVDKYQLVENAENFNVKTIDDSKRKIRWPKAEVEALIGVRSSYESRSQEPGMKSRIWEEVSSSMAAIGYSKSAKRCKEKWENVNKYLRTRKDNKDSEKKGAQHYNTSSYFHQLDQLYSKSHNSSSSTNLQNPSLEFAQQQPQMGRNFKFPEIDTRGSDHMNAEHELEVLQLQQGGDIRNICP